MLIVHKNYDKNTPSKYKNMLYKYFKSIVLLLTYAIDKDFFSKNGVNFQDN